MSDELKTENAAIAGRWPTTPAPEDAAATPGIERYYLVVFEQERSRMVELPENGELVVGRSDGVGLRLEEGAVSRRHACITLTSGIARVSDLDSQNGTFLNGQRVVGARAISSGDVIAIGSFTLVYHSSHRPAPSRAVLELEPLLRRLEEELERAHRYDRPLALLALSLGEDVDRAAIATISTQRLRLMDVVGWGAAGQLLVLLPETSADEAPEACARALTTVLPLAPQARAGYGVYPTDGCDADGLLAAARAAAATAAVGDCAAASKTYRELVIGDHQVLVADPTMTRLYALVERLAASDLPILVCGETGTGKELVSSAIHHWSPRKAGPLVAINCAAMPEALVESQLFGHERGTFSGAVASKPGLFEVAHGGTLFLDEIGEVAPTVQAKLLRAIETRRVTRLGDVRERDVDVRIVAATNRDLGTDVETGRFRRDLFFRLSGGVLWLPPLRDRSRELPLLTHAFLAASSARAGKPTLSLSDDAMRLLAEYPWPGNVRELKNLVDFLAAAVTGNRIESHDIAERLGLHAPRPARDSQPPPAAAPSEGARFRPIQDEIEELERRRISEALEAARGNQTRAADLIGMPLRTFVAKLKRHGLGRRA